MNAIVALVSIAIALTVADEEVVFSFQCPFYRVVGDDKASPSNSVTCRIWGCPGQTIDASLCEDSVGDNFLRLYTASGEVARNDDACGRFYGGSHIVYLYPYSSSAPCQEFILYQGCFDVNLCYGTTFVKILGEDFGHPSGQPTGAPTSIPSSFPTSPTSMPSSCPTSWPSSLPTHHPSLAPSSEPTYAPTSPSAQPSGQPSTFPTAIPSSAPSACPSSPSSAPSYIPSSQPTSWPTGPGTYFTCPPYEVEGDNRATSSNTKQCDIWICPGQMVTMDVCRNSFGDTFLRLFDRDTEIANNDDGCGHKYKGSKIEFSASALPGSYCRYYTIVEGCYDAAACSGVTHVVIHGAGDPSSEPSCIPSSSPSTLPTSPSGLPSAQPSGRPSHCPSSPSSRPSSAPTTQPSGTPTVQPSGAPLQPSSLPTDSPALPSALPTSIGKPNSEVTLAIIIGLPVAAVVLVVVVFVFYRYLKERYSVFLEINARVKCITSVADSDVFNEMDIFGDDEDYLELCHH